MDRSRREDAGKLTPKGRGVGPKVFSMGPLPIRLQVGGGRVSCKDERCTWLKQKKSGKPPSGPG
ncbi:hypothetical protein CCMA1212_006553 [Trichoderma ghanense]|uniref:Uncharacterized protein n=1 Tax=Trichoderma ghanense TaxID=65468 RepID=A0ABY2H0K2_9HYPO